RVVPVHVEQALCPRRADERQEAAETETLLAEVGLAPPELVLQAAELRGTELRHNAGEQRERVVHRGGSRREGHLRVALRAPLGQLDDPLRREVAQQLAEAAEAVVRLVEGRVLAQDRPLESR